MVAIERTAVADVSGWRFGTRGRDRNAIASSAFGAAGFHRMGGPRFAAHRAVWFCASPSWWGSCCLFGGNHRG
jgi:hypothetical protein